MQVDIMAVKNFAQCADEPLIFSDFTDTELVAYYTELFMSVIVDRGID